MPKLFLYSKSFLLTYLLLLVIVLFLTLILCQKSSNVFFLTRILLYVFSSPQHQSAYRRSYSTENTLLSTTNSFFQSSNTGKFTLLISLEFSAAFDTIDHPSQSSQHQLRIHWHRLLLASVIYYRLLSVRSHWPTFIHTYFMYFWCSPGFCPGATILYHIYITSI